MEQPTAVLDLLGEEPELAEEARLYVAWEALLDGSADGDLGARVAAAGGTPWLTAVFRTPDPVTENLETLERELEALARLAARSGPEAHFQIAWKPAAGAFEAAGYSFLLKRAAVTVTGQNPDATVLAGPLPAAPLLLQALYQDEIAAYVDGVAVSASATRQELEEAAAVLGDLDPGKPLVLDGVAWPASADLVPVEAARAERLGFAVTLFDRPRPVADDIAVLKVMANEFRGDLSYDEYSQPEGTVEGWAYVRGEDLELRVIALLDPDGGESSLFFPDPTLARPERVDLGSGQESPVFGQRRTDAGLLVPVEVGEEVALMRLARLSEAEVEERIEVADSRQMPVEEILRRLQAFEDDQRRRIDHYQAVNTMHLRFQASFSGIQASYRGPFFYRQGEGFDWAWEEFFFEGVKWRGSEPPEIPLVQPEKAAVMPLEITFTKEYAYRLRGSDTVEGRDCWVVDFEPLSPEPGAGLYQGTVWIDRQLYARVKTRALQTGLEGEVLSNEETVFFIPVDGEGKPTTWERESYVLPLRVVAQQVLSLLSAPVQVEIETQLTELRINKEGFEESRQTVLESDSTMVRDTERGMRYLVKDEEGNRVVQEEDDVNRLFLAGGVFWDESADFPIPLAGVNYLSLDFKGTGNQLNVFFGGALLTANYSEPRLFDSKWNAGSSLFGFFIPLGDELYRQGEEVAGEEVERQTASANFFLGRPLGNFAKLDLTYSLGFDKYQRADDTFDDFVLPQDTLTHSFQGQLTYARGGYRARLRGSYNSRQDWEPWGLPGNGEFDPGQEDYTRWQVSVAKTFWFPKFRKFFIELEHLNGSDLDRFSKYDFGTFADSSVAGYQGGLVTAEQANGLHLGYGIDVGNLFQVELEGDAVWARDEATGLDDELLGGVGLEGTVMGPWRTIINFELGVAVAGPGDGVSVRAVFLKLFD